MNELFMRQSSCAPNFSQCKNAGFPNYFCCPSGQRCLALAGNTTLLCCPEGSDCQRIEPLPCDISLQDGEKNPDAVVKTTALAGTLERCGTQCCPFGYSCKDGQCAMNQNQNAAPMQTNTAKPTATTTGAGTGATSDAGTTQTADPTSPTNGGSTSTGVPEGATVESSGPPVAAIAGGVTAGLVLLIGAAVLAFIFLRRKKKKDESQSGTPPKLSRSTSSFGNLISAPIMQENAFRSDFSRASPPREALEDPASVTGALIDSSANSPESSGTTTMPAVPPPAALGPDRQSGGFAYIGGGAGAAAGYGAIQPSQYAAQYANSAYVDMPPYDDPGSDDGMLMVPQTPRQHREPSSVSINVFADPNITPDRTPESNVERRYSNMTSFTQMLDKADLGGMARGESYLAGSPQMPPMPRR
jgi:hypothetical protein